MDSFTHVMSGILLYLLLPITNSPILLIYAAFMASLPDLDIILAPLKKKYDSYLLAHRGASHSLGGAMLMGVLWALMLYPFLSYSYLLLVMFGIGFYTLHITLDLLTMSKIPYFFPFTRREFKFGVERSVNVVLMVWSAFFFLVYLGIGMFSQDFYHLPKFTAIAIILYTLYFSHRILLKFIIQHRLQPSEKYIPNLLPCAYGIYEFKETSNDYSYSIEQHACLFPNTLPNFHEIIPKNSENEELFHLSLEKTTPLHFFRKWDAIVPLIRTLDGNASEVHVMIGLCESMSSKHLYYYECVYDKATHDILREKEGFQMFSDFYGNRTKIEEKETDKMKFDL